MTPNSDRLNKRLLGFLFFFIISLSSDIIAAATAETEPALPVPKGIKNELFYLQRDPNKNTVIYELNLKNGSVDQDKPVNVYWIRYEEKGQKQDLSSMQRRLGYGLNSKYLGKDRYELRFVSYDKLPLLLTKSETDNKYHIYARIKQKQAILNRIFVRVTWGTLGWPKVQYAELIGTDPSSGEEIRDRIYIKQS
ncbi:DUF4833 domain-containing protein [Desertivirga arenae]|uniref:DUF4833 domain-containing protein n=1 Tax=Desertivirga arenae TaxID=2810309 RepID=UPI001A96C6EF|nr:DUF4833 domain-containing protein [Pedobacter sp. SYSU D00823]